MNWTFWRKPEPPREREVPPPPTPLIANPEWFYQINVQTRVHDLVFRIAHLSESERKAFPWLLVLAPENYHMKFRAGNALIEAAWDHSHEFLDVWVTVSNSKLKVDVKRDAGPWSLEVDQYLTQWTEELEAFTKAKRDLEQSHLRDQRLRHEAKLEEARSLYVD